MNFNIYELSNHNEGKGSIKAVLNSKLQYDVIQILDKLKKERKIIKFCKNIGIKYPTLWDYVNRLNAIPLFVLNEMEKESGKNIAKNIEKLAYGAGITKRSANSVSTLTEDLAKIIGAFAADGHLKQRNVNRGSRILTHYELVFREEFETNMIALTKWFKNVFGICIKPKKEKNHFSIYISNKIIFRHFILFGFKSGRKTETIAAPKFVMNSNNAIKIAFIRGVLMFDGYVNKSNGYIELYSKSRDLVLNICEILNEIGLSPDYISSKADKFGRYRFIIRRQKKLAQCLILFEPQTEKWLRLNSCIQNFRRTKGEIMSKDKSEMIGELMHKPVMIRNIGIAAHID